MVQEEEGGVHDVVITEPKGVHARSEGFGDCAYGMRRLSCSESQDTIKRCESETESGDKDDKRSVSLHEMLRAGSTKTASTSVCESEAVEGTHCLGRAR